MNSAVTLIGLGIAAVNAMAAIMLAAAAWRSGRKRKKDENAE